jgi:hypothetical protein
MTKKFKLINNIIGWALGILASAVYIMTAEPTASWWDCGEYIATTYKLLIGHPPGAPTFQLIGRVFTLFAGGDVTKAAFCVNCMSAICSGLTIMFLYWTIVRLGRKMVSKLGKMTPGRTIAIFGSAIVGALTYTFTDTFWFSAVEGEVYAMSSFFTALVFWCILKWDEEYDNPKSNTNPNRWIVLIAYLIGLSIGVHLLNLLTLPAIVLIVYFKVSPKATYMGIVQSLAIISFFLGFVLNTGWMIFDWLFITIPLFVLCVKRGTLKSKEEWGVFLSLILSFVLLGAILYFIIPQIVNLAGKFEIFAVNSIGLPFHSGSIIFFTLLAALVAWGLYYGYKKNKPNFLAGVYCFIFILVGYSTFFTLVIRSNANPTIDENNPEDPVALLAYLNREQYGSKPIFYGQCYNSRYIGTKDGTPVYTRDDVSGKYIISDQRKDEKPVYNPADMMLFPRMWSSGQNHPQNYRNWLKAQYSGDSASDKENRRNLDKNKLPTYQQNLKFMHTYQFDYMYFRYFMWNFSGRQNDIQGHNDIDKGNWITGIPSFDKARLGVKGNDLPTSMERPGHNKYYLIPLILGLIGLVVYSMKDPKGSYVVLWLFLMTGLAIAFYLNMEPFQPRERDYAFAASFYAFSIWVGFGVYGIFTLFEKIKNDKVQVAGALLVTLICLGLVPGIMAKENWHDHDRSNRYTALAMAKNYLDSCAPNAILFTLGDNDTFPLWYAQEVEGYRTDVRVCNLSLLSTSWYVDQMKRQAYNSAPLPISMTWNQYKDGTRDMMHLGPAANQYVNLKDIVEYLKQPQFDNQRALYFLPADKYRSTGIAIPGSFSLDVDKEKVLANGTVDPKDSDLIVDKLRWNMDPNGVNTYVKAYIIMMDILANNNWERPIYYASTTGPEAYLGLEEYFQLEGMAFRLVPIKSPKRGYYDAGRINSDILYNNLMNVFNDHSRTDRVNNPNAPAKTPYPYAWGGMNDPRVYHSEDNIRLLSLIRKMHQRLAEQLINEGKIDSAEKVLDHCNEVLPNFNFPYLMDHQLGYSQTCVFFMRDYFLLNTPTGREKGLKMATDYWNLFVEEMAWFDRNYDDRVANDYAELINYNILFTQQMFSILNEYEVKMPEQELKKLKFDKFATAYIDKQNEIITRSLTDLEKNQEQLTMAFQSLKNITRLAQLTGNETVAQKGLQVAESQLAIFTQMDAGFGQSYRNFFYDNK